MFFSQCLWFGPLRERGKDLKIEVLYQWNIDSRFLRLTDNIKLKSAEILFLLYRTLIQLKLNESTKGEIHQSSPQFVFAEVTAFSSTVRSLGLTPY
jgi:hypothetical protein